jgi:uncharacterized protein (TIGR00375 family)
MQVIADLHLHSKFSRAVSKHMVVAEMSRQAQRKGIGLLATGDWFHSVWLKQLQADLTEWSEGVYQSRESPEGAKFVLSAEISNIFKQGGKSRRVHTLIFSPDFSVSTKINKQLIKRGCNLSSDGRPIIGLTVMDLAELVFSVSERCLVIPAHVWTPWYSMYGSKSGFDSVEEAYGEFADRIYAVETGLSSDSQMNWRIKELEDRAIVSFSDAHSPAKLGREATVFRSKNEMASDKLQMTDFSYDDIYQAIRERYLGRNEGKLVLSYTIEFYPEEGKYHYTGHRKCGVIQSPDETKQKGEVCHVCGRSLTVGVMHRVEELSGNNIKEPIKKKNNSGVVGYFHPTDKTRAPYVMMVPLQEILAEAFQVGSGSKRVVKEYDRLVDEFGSEFEVLMKTSIEKLEVEAGDRLASAIKRVREGTIFIKPGYDGVFGKVKIWPEDDEEADESKEQMALF